jgi:hypothetical protein
VEQIAGGVGGQHYVEGWQLMLIGSHDIEGFVAMELADTGILLLLGCVVCIFA